MKAGLLIPILLLVPLVAGCATSEDKAWAEYVERMNPVQKAATAAGNDAFSVVSRMQGGSDLTQSDGLALLEAARSKIRSASTTVEGWGDPPERAREAHASLERMLSLLLEATGAAEGCIQADADAADPACKAYEGSKAAAIAAAKDFNAKVAEANAKK